ncbi:MAG: hypothetical protein IKP66_04070 [Lachnospiraceae bacterium]|nr:hypothetical protein [Lachnospiraceae bacterium]
MGYDKNTKLITLDKVVIGGEEFLMTTREREEWEREQKEEMYNSQVKAKHNFNCKYHSFIMPLK